MQVFGRAPLTPAEEQALAPPPAGEGPPRAIPRVLSPLEEMLVAHPAPWECVRPKESWRGKSEPDPVILDRRGELVDFVDDPDFREAVVEAVNMAAASLATLAELDALCEGEPTQGRNHGHEN